MKTVDDYLKDVEKQFYHKDGVAIDIDDVRDLLIKFANDHVQNALNKVSKQDLIVGHWGGVDVKLDEISVNDTDGHWICVAVDAVGIKNSYTIDDIKNGGIK